MGRATFIAGIHVVTTHISTTHISSIHSFPAGDFTAGLALDLVLEASGVGRGMPADRIILRLMGLRRDMARRRIRTALILMATEMRETIAAIQAGTLMGLPATI